MAASNEVRLLDDGSFYAAIGDQRFAFVFFTAAWNAPCRMLAQTVANLSAERSSIDLAFYQIDTDASPSVSAAHGIRSVPACLLFDNGNVVDRVVGSNAETYYAAKIDAVMKR